jgi:arsenate reductase (thioredoxin)
MAKRPRILFVSGNGPCRAQMAEGFARYLAGDLVQVETAGSGDSALDTYGAWAMNEAGIDIALLDVPPLDSKDLTSYTHIVTLGDEAAPSVEGVRIDRWRVPDPSIVRAKPLDRIQAYRVVRNDIERRVKRLLSEALG